MQARDPVAVSAIDDAARYLGLAINCIITIANPPAIVLGGGMITKVLGFADLVKSYARRFSWALAWNRTTVRIATLGRQAQFLGAAYMLYEKIAKADHHR